MRRLIWKYNLSYSIIFSLEIPQGFETLCVDMQAGEPCLWALVDPDAKKINYEFKCMGTGHEFSSEIVEQHSYLGTVQEGPFVWHYFKKLKPWEPIETREKVQAALSQAQEKKEA